MKYPAKKSNVNNWGNGLNLVINNSDFTTVVADVMLTIYGDRNKIDDFYDISESVFSIEYLSDANLDKLIKGMEYINPNYFNIIPNLDRIIIIDNFISMYFSIIGYLCTYPNVANYYINTPYLKKETLLNTLYRIYSSMIPLDNESYPATNGTFESFRDDIFDSMYSGGFDYFLDFLVSNNASLINSIDVNEDGSIDSVDEVISGLNSAEESTSEYISIFCGVTMVPIDTDIVESFTINMLDKSLNYFYELINSDAVVILEKGFDIYVENNHCQIMDNNDRSTYNDLYYVFLNKLLERFNLI
nr:MAG TPA: hypothetical protein [Caudoviricetes sp.]